MSNSRKRPNRYRSLTALPVAAMTFFALSPAPEAAAVAVTWNIVGGGVWDTTSNNWIGGVPDPLKYVEGDDVFFSNVAGGTITLPANRAPASTNINATGGTYTFVQSPVAPPAFGITSGTLIKSNAGTGILNVNFSGSAITINGGVLALGTGSGDGINPSGGIITINSGGTLRNDATNRIQNGQRIVVNAGGTYNLNGRSDVVGAIAGAGAITLGTATLTLDDMDGSNFTGVISGSGGFILRGNLAQGIQTLSGANTFTGATTVSRGVLQLGNVSALANTSAISLAGGTTLRSTINGVIVDAPITVGAAGTTATIGAPTNAPGAGLVSTFTLNGPIGGAGNVTFTSTVNQNALSTILLNGQSNYTGTTLMDTTGTTATQLVVELGVDNALPTTTVLTIDGGSGSGSGRIISLDLNGFDQTLAGLNTAAGYSATTARNQRVTSATAATLTINGSTNSSFGGLGTPTTFNGNPVNPSAQITGAISLTKAGSGTFTLLDGVGNTYTGLTTINAGALRIAHANSLGSTAAGTVVNSNGRLELVNNITTNAGEALTISGTGGNFFGALQSQNGDNTWAGSVLIGANDTRLGTADGADRVLRISGVIDDGGNGHSIAVRHEFADAVLELSGANTYGGATKMFAGVLRIAGGDNRLPIGTSLDFGVPGNNGGFTSTFDLNGFNQRVAGLTMVDSGTPDVHTVTNSGVLKTFTVNTEVDNDYGGLITGNLALTKAGNGSLILSGANTFTGNVTVQDGVLNVRNSSALGSTGKTVTVAQSGQTPALELQDNIDVIIGTLRTSGLGIGGNGALRNISGNNSITANSIQLIGGNGNSRWQSDAGLLTINGNISDNTTVTRSLILGGAGDGLINGNMSDGPFGMSLEKNGTGTWTLTGNGTYTGNTTINGGLLVVNGSLNNTAVTVNAGGTLGGEGSIGGSVTLNNGTIAPGSSIESLATGNNVWIGNTTFDFEFSTDGSTGSAGTEWDLLAITGSLDLTSSNQVTMNLITMSDANTPGLLAVWNPNVDAVWEGFVTTTQGIIGFNPAEFVFVTTSPLFFQNPLNGSFSVVQSGNNLDLVYTVSPIPEPASLALLTLGGAAMLARRRRHA